VTAYDAVAEAMEGHDAVVNLALSPLFKPKQGDERHFDVHLGGTENVVRAAEEAGAEYVLQMSALGADPNGPTAYIRSKGAAEGVVRDSDLEHTIVRPSVVFGDGGEFVTFTKKLTTPYVTGLPGGGKSQFQPIWVEDIVPMLADCVGDESHWGDVRTRRPRGVDARGRGPTRLPRGGEVRARALDSDAPGGHRDAARRPPAVRAVRDRPVPVAPVRQHGPGERRLGVRCQRV